MEWSFVSDVITNGIKEKAVGKFEILLILKSFLLSIFRSLIRISRFIWRKTLFKLALNARAKSRKSMVAIIWPARSANITFVGFVDQNIRDITSKDGILLAVLVYKQVFFYKIKFFIINEFLFISKIWFFFIKCLH